VKVPRLQVPGEWYSRESSRTMHNENKRD